MKRITFAAFLLSAACVAYADDHEKQILDRAHQLVTKDFKDPLGAQYRNEQYYEGVSPKDGRPFVVVCGEVNGKNSYGAYVGFRPYYVMNDKVSVRDPNDASFFDSFAPMVCDRPPNGEPIKKVQAQNP